jgi:hypothetical protein
MDAFDGQWEVRHGAALGLAGLLAAAGGDGGKRARRVDGCVCQV